MKGQLPDQGNSAGGLRAREWSSQKNTGQKEAREVDAQVTGGLTRPAKDLGLHPEGCGEPLKNFLVT